jgi:hypothetical protein
MWKIGSTTLLRSLVYAAVLLIVKVTASVVIGYCDYLPPNFRSDFLLGRESYFWGPYSWAFYVHLLSGPASLIFGTLLVSDRFRRSMPRWHRSLGRLQVACILLLLVPSGLWMSQYAATGAVAAAGLGLLAIVTAACTALGWRAALARRFDIHRRWMLRTYVLLCSAVVIRLIGGLAIILSFEALWLYPLSAWMSWLLPLIILEVWQGKPKYWQALPLSSHQLARHQQCSAVVE